MSGLSPSENLLLRIAAAFGHSVHSVHRVILFILSKDIFGNLAGGRRPGRPEFVEGSAHATRAGSSSVSSNTTSAAGCLLRHVCGNVAAHAERHALELGSNLFHRHTRIAVLTSPEPSLE